MAVYMATPFEDLNQQHIGTLDIRLLWFGHHWRYMSKVLGLVKVARVADEVAGYGEGWLGDF